MRKIIVTSDTHGDRSLIERVREQAGDYDLWFHAGDRFDDVDDLSGEVHAVCGNVDYSEDNAEKILEVGEHRVLITHGHHHHVKSGLTGLYFRAKEAGATVVVFGHTHQRLATEEDGILFFNPGSLCRPKDGKGPAYGILTIENADISHNFIDLRESKKSY